MKPLFHASISVRVAVMLGTLVVVGACTAVVDITTTQCRSQADCLSRGPEFADTTCSPDRVCVKIPSVVEACKTNQECVDKNNGAPATCRKSDRKCVNLLSTECPRVLADKEDIISEDIIWIGYTGAAIADCTQAENGMELARTEIKKAGGIPALTPGSPSRVIGIVICNSELTTIANNANMVKHLYQNIQVPASVAGFTSGDAVQINQGAVQGNALNFCQNQVDKLTSLDPAGRVLRIGFPDGLTLSAQGPFVRDHLEARIRADFALAPTDPVRVTVLKNVRDYDDQLEALRKNLTVNGLGMNENISAGNLQVVEFGGQGDPINFPNPDAERAKAVTATIAFKPHLILMMTNPPLIAQTWLQIQRTWTTGAAGIPRPWFIGGFPTIPSFIQPQFSQFAATAPPGVADEARKKTLGMRTLPFDYNKAELDDWIGRFQTKFPELVGQSITTTGPIFYDAIYMFAYAAAAIKGATLNGIELRNGMNKVASASGGAPIKWGPEEYPKGIAALGQGGSIGYKGVIGSYGFDQRGEHPGNPEVYCFGPGPTYLPISSGWAYNVQTATSSGGLVNCN